MRKNIIVSVATSVVAAAVFIPAVGWAQVGSPTESAGSSVESREDVEAGDAAERKKWSVSASVVTRAYQGVFASLENDDAGLNADEAIDPSNSFDRWLNLYVLSGRYRIDDFTVGAALVGSHWMTAGGGYTDQYEFRIEDPSLSVNWAGYEIEPIDARVSANYVASFPLSDVSRTANKIMSNTLAATLSKTFWDRLTLSYTLGGAWMPSSVEVATISPETDTVYREDDLVGNDVAAVNGYNSQFSVTNSLSARIAIWKKLSASVAYSLSKYWTYDAGNDDAFTPDVDGIQTGRMTADRTVASVMLSYPIKKYLSVSGGLRTVQAPKTADNKSYRFPWWNFTGAAANRSALQLTVTGSY